MKYLSNRRLRILFLFVTLITVSFISCDKLIKSENSEKEEKEQTIEAINNSKKEAKLLLMLSMDNQDAIKLSQILQNRLSKDSIADLAKNIEETHVYVAKYYNNMASDKLISIPNYSELSKKETTENNIVKIAKRLKKKINSQLYLLDKLYETTKSKDFKLLVNYTNSKLENSLTKTKNIINTLNTNS